MQTTLTAKDLDRIIEMAWEEKEVIELMRSNSKKSRFKMWRKRMNGRKTKHSALRTSEVTRFKCSRQRTISSNKISKR